MDYNNWNRGPPSESDINRMAAVGRNPSLGVWCERCNSRLVELKKQALRLMIMYPSLMKLAMKDSSALLDRLHIPPNLQEAWSNHRCEICASHEVNLKQEAVEMVQSLEDAHAQQGASSLGKLSGFVGSSNLASLQRYLYANHSHNNNSGGQRPVMGMKGRPLPSLPAAMQAQQYLEETIGPQWWTHPKFSAFFNSQPQANFGAPAPSANKGVFVDIGLPRGPPLQQSGVPYPQGDSYAAMNAAGMSPASLGLGVRPSPVVREGNISGSTATASFFARAAQKLNLSSKKKRKQQEVVPDPILPPPAAPEPPIFPTNFSDIIKFSPPAAPSSLMRNVNRVKENPGVGKVKVMLKMIPSSNPNDSASFVTVDTKRKQVTLFDPSVVSGFVTPAGRRAGVAAPKMFAFDAIFPQESTPAEVCSNSVADIVQAVVSGADGCLFCYGHSHLGKTYTMIGSDENVQSLGTIPSAIAWLFKLINEKKERTSTRFSVRVSAVEVYGKQESLRDLLVEQATGSNNGCGTSPGLYLQEDPICGVQLLNQSELRAPSAEKAAFYLDAAIASRINAEQKDDLGAGCYSHMLFTLHVYQYRIDKFGKGGVIGGRSRLHLIDLGSGEKGSGKVHPGEALTFSALGNVILAVLNGQKHIPYRDSKITRLLREAMGSVSCRTVMIAHASAAIPHYSETLSTIQLASRIHRLRKKKSKYSGTSSSGGESSCEEGRIRRMRPRYPRTVPSVPEGMRVTNALNQSDPEYLSSSEQSCDTVIYVGPDGCPLSDQDLTDNEGPPDSLPIFNLNLSDSQEEKSDEKAGSSDDCRLGRSSESEGEMTLPVGFDADGISADKDAMNSSSRIEDDYTISGKDTTTKEEDSKKDSRSKVTKEKKEPEVAKKPSKLKLPSEIKKIKKPVPPPRQYYKKDFILEEPEEETSVLDLERASVKQETNDSGFLDGRDESKDTDEVKLESNTKDPDILSLKELVDCDERENFEELERERLSDSSGSLERSRKRTDFSPKNEESRVDMKIGIDDVEEDELTAALRTVDADFISQAAKCVNLDEPPTPTNEPVTPGESLPLTRQERKFLVSKALMSADPERILRSLSSFDKISELLEKPVSELSEDEVSLAFSEQETLSYVSRGSDELTTVTDTLTVDDMPLGSEAVCWLQQIAQKSLDAYSENLASSINNISVGACVEEPYLLLGMEERRKKMQGGHYVYSDDESEVADSNRRVRRSLIGSEHDTLDSISLASHDLEAIKSMYVISSLNVDNLSVDSDPLDDGELPPGLLQGVDRLLSEEPAVMTYMTINNDDQVVMREKHMADDHPLRRLSCISDATDATFSTTSRPSSYIDRDDDYTHGQTSTWGSSNSTKYSQVKSPLDLRTNEKIVAALHLQKLQAQILARAIAANHAPRNQVASPKHEFRTQNSKSNINQVSGDVSPVWQKMDYPDDKNEADSCISIADMFKINNTINGDTLDDFISEKCEKNVMIPNAKCDDSTPQGSPRRISHLKPPSQKCHHKTPLLGVSAAVNRNNGSPVFRQDEMWNARRPDGACTDDSLVDSEMSKIFSQEDNFVCEERPPVIGACASPPFEVEMNPCYSQEYDYDVNNISNGSIYHKEKYSSPRRKLHTVPEVENHIYVSLEPESPERRKVQSKIPQSNPKSEESKSKSNFSKLPLPNSLKTPSRLPPRKPIRGSSGSKSDSETRKSSSRPPKGSKSVQNSKLPQSTSKTSTPTKTGSKTPSGSKPSALPTRNKSLSKSAPSLNKSHHSTSTKLPSREKQIPLRNGATNIGQPGKRLTNASDSSNDSGIASGENPQNNAKPSILSPYSKVTEPRVVRGSSSGHGSDNSSQISDHPPAVIARRLNGASGMSSGYESNRRDSYSEATGSAPDSLSEGSCGKVRGNKLAKKKFANPKRNRSIPRSSASDTGVPVSTRSSRRKDIPPRPLHPEAGVEIKVYEVDDPQTIKQQRTEPVKCMFWKKWTPNNSSALKPWKKRQPSWKSD